MGEVVEHEPGEAFGLVEVGIPGEDEGIDPGVLVGGELGPDLVGVADDGSTGSGAGATDTGPQVGLGVPVRIGALPQLVLTADAGGRSVE